MLKKPLDQWTIGEIISYLISQSEHVPLVPKHNALFFLLGKTPAEMMQEVREIHEKKGRLHLLEPS
jgi:hypothetical protein